MALADDILFEPVDLTPVVGWRKLAEDLVAYIKVEGDRCKPMFAVYPLDRDRPAGSLTLAEMMELCHEGGQNRFFLVQVGKHTKLLQSFPFDGQIEWLRYEEGKSPRLSSFNQFSIRDMNLVPNVYTRHFVFATETDARTYMNTI